MNMHPWTPTTNALHLRRFGKLGEELGELQAVASRCVIQGIDEIDPSSGRSNRERLVDELADVMAQCLVTMKVFDLESPYIHSRVQKKMEQMDEWERVLLEQGK